MKTCVTVTSTCLGVVLVWAMASGAWAHFQSFPDIRLLSGIFFALMFCNLLEIVMLVQLRNPHVHQVFQY